MKSGFHYDVSKNPPLVPILSEMNHVYAIQNNSLRPILILHSDLRLGL
jgi:hypothetical protein